MADRALCRFAGPVVSRGVLRQRSDGLNHYNGRFNDNYQNIEHY
jgi:hypothetical protein